MSNENKAGALILSQLGMFNEAVSLLATIESKFFEAFDESVSGFAEENGWVGNYDLSDNEDCWVAPNNWNMAEPEEDHDPKAKFAIDTINHDANDYWIALFCEQGKSGGEAGFMFDVNYKVFGGKTTWNNFAKTINQSMSSKLLRLGFKNKGKGIYFLPIHLDANLLANTWEENGEFAHDDDCFEPLRQAFGKLKESQEIFTQILSKASGKT